MTEPGNMYCLLCGAVLGIIIRDDHTTYCASCGEDLPRVNLERS